jgi:hypothetical protein
MEKRKNCWVIPTDKPSRLYLHSNNQLQLRTNIIRTSEDYLGTNQNIYITDDSKIKDRDWYISLEGKLLQFTGRNVLGDKFKAPKIILTTDQDLIKDGVQSIDDDFLEWFVNNPSCEYIQTTELSLFNGDTGESGHYKYEIIIPQEEPKTNSCCGRCNGVDDICIFDREEPKQELELKDFESGDILDVLNMGNVEYLGNGDIIYNPNLFFIKRGDKWFIKNEKPKQELHTCKHCGAETTQPDDECYAKPKQETTVEWLEKEIESISIQVFDGFITFIEFMEQREQLFKKAKELEKEQIINSLHYFGIENAQDYYTETYGGQENEQ